MGLLLDLCTKSSLLRYGYYIAWNSALIWSLTFDNDLIVGTYFSISIASASANNGNS